LRFTPIGHAESDFAPISKKSDLSLRSIRSGFRDQALCRLFEMPAGPATVVR
jgi:hypothetical protein